MLFALLTASILFTSPAQAADWLDGVDMASFVIPHRSSADCVSAENATPDNFRKCPAAVRKAIFDAAPALELTNVEGQAFRAYVSGLRGYCYVKGHTVLYTAADYSESAAKYGLFRLLVLGEESTNAVRRWTISEATARYWKGAILVMKSSIMIYEPVFPHEPEELLRIIYDTNQQPYARIDALAAYLPAVSDAEKAAILMHILRDPRLNEGESIPLFAYLAGLGDERAPNTLLELLNDKRIVEEVKSVLVDIAVKNSLITPQVQEILLSAMEGTACGPMVNAAVNAYMPEARYRKALGLVISRCQMENKAALSAMAVANTFKIEEAVPPVIGVLTALIPVHRERSGRDSWIREYTDRLSRMMKFLAMMRSVSALKVLKDDVYFNNADPRIAGPAREAVREIEGSRP